MSGSLDPATNSKTMNPVVLFTALVPLDLIKVIIKVPILK